MILLSPVSSTSVVVGLLFCGALGLLTFFILLLYIRNKENIYLYYGFFLLFSLTGGLINLEETTLLSASLTDGPGVAHRNLETATLLALCAYCFFAAKLLDLKNQSVWLARWVFCLGVLTALYGLVYWFLYPFIVDQAELFFIVSRSVILPMSLIAIVWVAWKVDSPIRNYFIVGSTLYFTGALLAVLRSTAGFVPIKGFYAYGATVYFHSGILLETICFALALSHRIHLLYQAKQKEQENIRAQAVFERDLAQAQMLASRMQINPHFIFNCLNAIKYMIQRGQKNQASKYLTVFSRFVRIVLESGNLSVVSLAEELEITENYLILESNRFDEHFSHQITVAEGVDTHQVLIPPMLLQPFVENGIWHGLLRSDRLPRQLNINVRKQNGAIQILIEDNGRGRDGGSSPRKEKFHKSSGMQITAERINLYNNNYKGRISCKTIDKTGEGGEKAGTVVILTIEEDKSEAIKIR